MLEYKHTYVHTIVWLSVSITSFLCVCQHFNTGVAVAHPGSSDISIFGSVQLSDALSYLTPHLVCRLHCLCHRVDGECRCQSYGHHC